MNKELRFAALLALLSLGGCATSDVAINDGSTFVPSARVAFDIATSRADPPARLSDPHSSHAIELNLVGAKGSDVQDLRASDDPVVIGGERFVGPQRVTNDFDFRLVDLRYRFRHVFERSRIGLEALAGVGYAQLAVTVTGTTQRASERLRNLGFAYGGGALWRMGGSTSLQARLNGFVNGASDNVSSVFGFDLHLVQALGGNAAVRAGWSSWSVRSERENDFTANENKSPILVRFSGPALGLELMF
jgi:hypothetical protein